MNMVEVILNITLNLTQNKWKGNDKGSLIFMGVIFLIIGITRWGEW